VHCPAASATMLGGAQRSRSDVTTAHMNSISGERLSREACGPIDSQDKMKLGRRGFVTQSLRHKAIWGEGRLTPGIETAAAQ
jgi:hypothetical protein